MNGADRLCDELLVNDVDVCFANPGTSEMHFVAALDRKPRMRCVLGLFEGVVTPRRTAMLAWPTSPRRRCCISGRVSQTALRTFITPGGHARR